MSLLNIGEIYNLKNRVRSSLVELQPGTKVIIIGKHKLERYDIRCVDTGKHVLCVEASNLEQLVGGLY